MNERRKEVPIAGLQDTAPWSMRLGLRPAQGRPLQRGSNACETGKRGDAVAVAVLPLTRPG